jgi:cytochrome c
MRKYLVLGIFTLALAWAAGLSVTTALKAEGEADERTLSSAGDAVKGKRVFMRCQACHTLVAGQHRMGPSIANLFGQKAGAAAGFTRYSNALKEADFVWTEAALDQWLASPKAFLPGNKMPFAGLPNPQDRKDLLAYLREVFDSQ